MWGKGKQSHRTENAGTLSIHTAGAVRGLLGLGLSGVLDALAWMLHWDDACHQKRLTFWGGGWDL